MRTDDGLPESSGSFAVLGSPEWLESTGGVLTGSERRRMVLRAYGQLPKFVGHRLRASIWRRRPSTGAVAFDFENVPRSDFARDAIAACRHESSVAMQNHSYRTWAFGQALAELDDVCLDADQFFVAALLHDIGLACPTYGTCFTRAGARKAKEIDGGLDVAAAAISQHITPGLKRDHAEPHAYYIQQGSVLDLGGLRAYELPVDWVMAVCRAWPTCDVRHEAGRRWRAEAAMVHHGRAHNLDRWSFFSRVTRFTPIPPLRRDVPDTPCPEAGGGPRMKDSHTTYGG